MLNRRQFLKSSATLAGGSLLLSESIRAAILENMISRPVGLQLFTLFNVMDDDVPGTLKKIADIGYKEIESAFSKKGGYYGLKPKEFAAMAKDHGLSWQSHHVLGAPFKLPPGTKLPNGPDGKPMTVPPMRNLKENGQQLIDEAAEAGIPYLVCAMIPTGTTAEIKSSIHILNTSAEACKKAGITMAYHNHDMEFKQVDGKIPYHLLLSETDPGTLKMELDLAWVTKAGVDPVELFKKHPGRFPLWHVKDIAKDLETLEPVGNGIVDFKRIFAHSETAGLRHFFVEHDMPADPYASISTSFANLNKMLG